MFISKKNRSKNIVVSTTSKNELYSEIEELIYSYIQNDMTIEEITEIIDNMKSDYEERVDDYIIRKAEFSKERRAINKQVKELLKEEKTKSN